MAYRRKTLTAGKTTKRALTERIPAHLGMSHSVRIPGVAGICEAVGMSPTRSHPGPAAELHPNHPKARPATRPIVDGGEAGAAIRDRTAPAPVHPGTRSRNSDPLN
jgi:hypothetical protein